MNEEYQVGDLFCAVWKGWDGKDLFLLTAIPEEDVHIITCMRTYKNYGYSKEGMDSTFRKVA